MFFFLFFSFYRTLFFSGSVLPFDLSTTLLFFVEPFLHIWYLVYVLDTGGPLLKIPCPYPPGRVRASTAAVAAPPQYTPPLPRLLITMVMVMMMMMMMMIMMMMVMIVMMVYDV